MSKCLIFSIFSMYIYTMVSVFSSDAFAAEYVSDDVSNQNYSPSFYPGYLVYNHAFRQLQPINSSAPTRITRPITYNAASFKNLLSLKKYTPAGFVISAAAAAAGYLWDNESEEITRNDTSRTAGDIRTSSRYCLIGVDCNSERTIAENIANCNAWRKYSSPNDFCYLGTTNPNEIRYTWNDGSTFKICSAGYTHHENGCHPTSTVTDEELMSDVAPLLDYDDVFTDDGLPIATPELNTELDNVNDSSKLPIRQ